MSVAFLRGLGRKKKSEPEIQPKGYLTFSSAEPFTVGVANNKKNWDGTLYYSTDTTTWSEWDGTAAFASAEHDGQQRIYMRGRGNSYITETYLDYTEWVLTGSNISCNGNIENLLDYETVANGKHPAMSARCFLCMFLRCTALIRAPELPATTLAEKCYSHMFEDCTSLTSAPELPATTLATDCYEQMFNGCTSLTTAPELPATTLAESCYIYMFWDCTSLKAAPKLPVTTLAEKCYYGMFNGCTSLTSAPELPATTLATACYRSMFWGCTSLTSAPELPATTLKDRCYYCMFRGCTSIKVSETKSTTYKNAYRIPYEGEGTTATDALYYMFYGTGGTFTGTPEINTTYYTSNTVV